MWSTDCTENKPGASHCYGDHEDENSSSCYFAFIRSVELLGTVRCVISLFLNQTEIVEMNNSFFVTKYYYFLYY